MILLLNVFLKPEGAATWFEYDRGGRPRPPQHEVLLHTLRTYAQAEFNAAYLNVEFHPDYVIDKVSFAAEAMAAISCPVAYDHEQVKIQAGWQELVRRIEVNNPGESVWLSGNHDHPIVDPTMIEPIKRLVTEEKTGVSVIYSHWSEFVDQAIIAEGTTLHPTGFVSYQCNDVHSIRILSQDVLRAWWFDHDYGDIELPRSDWWVDGGPWDGGHMVVKSPWYRSYVPLREVCRHFDGYSHLGLDPASPLPPLTIPHEPDTHSQIDKINCVPRIYGRSVPAEWCAWL